MLEQLQEIETQTLRQLESVIDSETLAQLFRSVLGDKGTLKMILRSLGQLPVDQRPTVGQRANEVRVKLEEAFAAREEAIRARELDRNLAEGAIDVTLPGRRLPMGRIHPANQALREITAIWAEMGFQVFRSPDVETDDNNFTLLNMPPYHPARDMWSTFFTAEEGVILRTHTSPGQIHAMRAFAPEPIRVILPGMCYRYEQVSVRSEFQFNQVEGLAIGPGIRFTDLKGTMAAFARRFYGQDRQVRFRASHFPFTEPSMEIDVECILCDGGGCPVCKHTGWLEIAGSGMVHPVVLKNGGYDPAKVSGFAFGMGVERSVMLKHGIQDIRVFWGNDLRLLEQF